MPSQTRSSSQIRSSAAKKIQRRFKTKKRQKQELSSAMRRIQRSYRGFKSRKNIKRMKDNMSTDNCSWCLEPMNHLTQKVAIALPCFHVLHTECMLKGLSATDGRCPNCMVNVNNISFRRRQARAQPLPPPQQSSVINMTNAQIQSLRPPRQTQRAISGNPSPHLLHLQRRWDAQSRLDRAQQELTDYQISEINDPQRERILNNTLRFATRELADAMRNFTNG